MKALQVEVSIERLSSILIGSQFQQLTFVPYAYHRNITATGSLTVGGKSTFNGEVAFQDITVEGTADIEWQILI